MGRRSVGIVERFWSKVRPEIGDACWEWSGARGHKGYGQIRISNSVTGRAHRISWEIHFGPIPDGLHVCHKCDNPSCVRPDHLFIGTNQQNVDDKVRKGRAIGPASDRAQKTKLTWDLVAEIRSRPSERAVDLAVEYGVTDATISKIMKRQTWIEGRTSNVMLGAP